MVNGFAILRLFYTALGAVEGSLDTNAGAIVIGYFRQHRYLLKGWDISWQNFKLHLALYLIPQEPPEIKAVEVDELDELDKFLNS